MAVPDLDVGNEYVWKSSIGTSYDVKLLRVHGKFIMSINFNFIVIHKLQTKNQPMVGCMVKESRVRQEEDSPPSSTEDGCHQDSIVRKRV